MRAAATAAALALAAAVSATGGCKKDGADAAADGSVSPAAAARCELEAVRARSLERWTACIHPAGRAEFKAALEERIAEKPHFWDDFAAGIAGIDTARDSDYVLDAMPAGREKYGDKHASLTLSTHHKIELARTGGRWYVVDPD